MCIQLMQEQVLAKINYIITQVCFTDFRTLLKKTLCKVSIIADSCHCTMRLYHSKDGSTYPWFKLMCFGASL
jgi:hypothetical protein